MHFRKYKKLLTSSLNIKLYIKLCEMQVESKSDKLRTEELALVKSLGFMV